MNQITTPAAWSAYINNNPAINYVHINSWTSAAIQGALLTYGLITPSQAPVPDIFTSVIGAVGLSAGKVVFGWAEGA